MPPAAALGDFPLEDRARQGGTWVLCTTFGLIDCWVPPGSQVAELVTLGLKVDLVGRRTVVWGGGSL